MAPQALLAVFGQLCVASLLVLGSQLWWHAPARLYVQPAFFSAAESSSILAQAAQSDDWIASTLPHLPAEAAHLSSIPELQKVSDAIEDRVLPLLRTTFGLHRDEDLVVALKDLFLVRFAPGQPETEMYTDYGTISFAIALSARDQYAGGGFDFDLVSDGPVVLPQGALLMHPAKLSYRGAAVEEGRLYMLLGRVSVGDDSLFAPSAKPGPGTHSGFWARCVRTVALPSATGTSEAPTVTTGEEQCRSAARAFIGELEAGTGLELAAINALLLLLATGLARRYVFASAEAAQPSELDSDSARDAVPASAEGEPVAEPFAELVAYDIAEDSCSKAEDIAEQ